MIIPNYNYAHFLKETVESALSQTYSNIEVVVVDDGSTDNSLEVLAQFAKDILLIESENRGSCVARNLGMSKASGQYLAFLDADDTWDPEKIDHQISHLKKSNADLVFCQMRAYGEASSQYAKGGEMKVNHEWFLRNPGATPFSPSAVLLTQELASKVGNWNTSLTGPAEDFDYFRRCAKLGEISCLNEILVSHRQHPGSLTAANARRYFEDNRRVLKIMFVEDRSKLNIVKRNLLWINFHKNFMKHALKQKSIRLMLVIVKGFFQFSR